MHQANESSGGGCGGDGDSDGVQCNVHAARFPVRYCIFFYDFILFARLLLFRLFFFVSLLSFSLNFLCCYSLYIQHTKLDGRIGYSR